MRLTIAVPVAHVENANHYAMALGYSEADGLTYGAANWEDAAGNLYAVASVLTGAGFVENATSALPRPAWDTESVIDLAKATQAQALVVLWAGVGTPPLASPDQITAIAGMEGRDAVEAMGLSHVVPDELI
ncbi:MAG: hypothetical protein V7786_02050 [Sulfitobacter litoralis]|uniref:hypothetical protein n=1 Tax=Sulfitobacter litoralis TaxID=335975 RepID=UPI003001465B